MKIVDSYLEKGWGDSVDNPNLTDVEIAIQETQNMDDEHCVFEVGIIGDDDNHISLAVNKYLLVTLILDPENLEVNILNEKQIRAESWDEVLDYYRPFINGEVDKVKEKMSK